MPTVKNGHEFLALLKSTLEQKLNRPINVITKGFIAYQVVYMYPSKLEATKDIISDVLENEFSIQISDCEIAEAPGVIAFRLPDYIVNYFQSGKW